MATRKSKVVDFSDTDHLIDNMVTMLNPTEQLAEHIQEENDRPRIDLRKKKKLDNFQLRKDLINNETNLTIEYNIYLRETKIGVIKPEHSPLGIDIKFFSDFPNVIPNAKAASVKDMLKLLTSRIEAARDFIRLFESD